MKTLSFIGSDKNAGKTTALNFVARQLREDPHRSGPLCLSSIGINGEAVDAYESRAKPRIPLVCGDYFVTAAEQLRGLNGRYEIIHSFSVPGFAKHYLLGRCLFDLELVLEGPNDKQALRQMKERLAQLLPQGRLLLDGSIDRQFLADPSISDEIYFALLVSDREPQRQKARDLLYALQLPACSRELQQFLRQTFHEETRSLLIDDSGHVLFQGAELPFRDGDLRNACQQHRQQDGFLYLRGALTRSLADMLASRQGLKIVLDNFTLYQDVATSQAAQRSFRPQLLLRHPALIKQIFLKQETPQGLELKTNIPVRNLFAGHQDAPRD